MLETELPTFAEQLPIITKGDDYWAKSEAATRCGRELQLEGHGYVGVERDRQGLILEGLVYLDSSAAKSL